MKNQEKKYNSTRSDSINRDTVEKIVKMETFIKKMEEKLVNSRSLYIKNQFAYFKLRLKQLLQITNS